MLKAAAVESRIPPSDVIDVEIINEVPSKIKFIHLRYHFEGQESQQNRDGTSNRGGCTIAYRILPGEEVEWTFALCCLKDNFCRKTGRTICEQRFKSDVYYRKAWPGDVSIFMDEVVKPLIYKKADEKNHMNFVESVLW